MISTANARTLADGRHRNDDVRFGLGTCSRSQNSSSASGSSTAAEGILVTGEFTLFLLAALVLALRRSLSALNVALPDPLLSNTASDVDGVPVWATTVAKVLAEKSARYVRCMHWALNIRTGILRVRHNPKVPFAVVVESNFRVLCLYTMFPTVTTRGPPRARIVLASPQQWPSMAV